MSMTHADAHKALMIHLVAYVNLDITEAFSRSWWIHFADCAIDEFNAALHIAVDQARAFPPTPGEVRAALRRLRADASELEMPEEAWLAVYHNRGTPSALALQAASMLHDWDDRGHAWSLDQVEWKRKEFIRIYAELRDRAEVLRVQKMAVERLGARSLPAAARALLEGSK